MKRQLRLSAQVIDYVRALAPEPRQAVKAGLKILGSERGDIRALEGPLSGYYRLRVGRFRVIFSYAADGAIEAIFIEDRSLVYEVFEAEFIRRMKK